MQIYTRKKPSQSLNISNTMHYIMVNYIKLLQLNSFYIQNKKHSQKVSHIPILISYSIKQHKSISLSININLKFDQKARL